MSVPSSTNPNRNPTPNHQGSDEIDLGQVFHYVGKVVKRFLRLLFDILNFFKRRFLLFTGIALAGFGIGYVWDQLSDNKLYTQEIIIEPNYGSTSYLYNFIDNINGNLSKTGMEDVIPEVSLQTLKRVKTMVMYPIVNYKDILEYNNIYAKDDKGYLLLSDIEKNFAQYRDQFKLHKIQFTFKGDNIENTAFIPRFIDFLNTIQYFEDLKGVNQKELTERIKETEKSITFINSYTNKLTKRDISSKEQDIITIGGENDIPTVSTLLREKDRLLAVLANSRKELTIHDNIVKLIDRGFYVKKPGLLYKKSIILSMLLVSLLLVFFLMKYILDSLAKYISQEE